MKITYEAHMLDSIVYLACEYMLFCLANGNYCGCTGNCHSKDEVAVRCAPTRLLNTFLAVMVFITLVKKVIVRYFFLISGTFIIYVSANPVIGIWTFVRAFIVKINIETGPASVLIK